jgi:hypothetical protein
MGGYAALAVGCLIGADEVHAFSPQTFIDQRLRARVGDERWADEIAATYSGGRVPWLLRDLRRLFTRHPLAARAPGRFHIHVAGGYQLDAVHARRLRRSAGVTLHEHAWDGHDLVKALRESGELHRILDRAVRNGSGHDRPPTMPSS